MGRIKKLAMLTTEEHAFLERRFQENKEFLKELKHDISNFGQLRQQRLIRLIDSCFTNRKKFAKDYKFLVYWNGFRKAKYSEHRILGKLHIPEFYQYSYFVLTENSLPADFNYQRLYCIFQSTKSDEKYLHLFLTFEKIFHYAKNKIERKLFGRALKKRSEILGCNLRQVFEKPYLENDYEKMVEIHMQAAGLIDRRRRSKYYFYYNEDLKFFETQIFALEVFSSRIHFKDELSNWKRYIYENCCSFQGIEEIEGYPFENIRPSSDKEKWLSRKLISVLAKALQNSDDRRITSLVDLIKHCFQTMQKISVREQFIVWRCLSRYASEKKQYIDMGF